MVPSPHPQYVWRLADARGDKAAAKPPTPPEIGKQIKALDSYFKREVGQRLLKTDDRIRDSDIGSKWRTFLASLTGRGYRPLIIVQTIARSARLARRHSKADNKKNFIHATYFKIEV